jgi:D-threo-aldose 1-dehydrogenase
LIQAAKDAKIGYFDTAPWYGFGRSERVMGDLLRGTQYVLSDKVGRLLKPGAVENPMDFGMIEPLPFNVVYDYSYDGIMRPLKTACNVLGLIGSIYCLRMILAPTITAPKTPAISRT